MKLTNNEKITMVMALKLRREKFIELAKTRIDYLKSIHCDITGDEHVLYFVDNVNECSKLIAKVRNSYSAITID